MNNEEQGLPPFQIVATLSDFLTDREMDQIIADHAPFLTETRIEPGRTDATAARFGIAAIPRRRVRYRWLYRLFRETAQFLNARFFCVDISDIEGDIALMRYQGSDNGYCDWHTDLSERAPRRKLSIAVQLSRPEDYDGGGLELLFRPQAHELDRTRGTLIATPSFALRRVAPVTRGTRWSLLARIEGPRWS